MNTKNAYSGDGWDGLTVASVRSAIYVMDGGVYSENGAAGIIAWDIKTSGPGFETLHIESTSNDAPAITVRGNLTS